MRGVLQLPPHGGSTKGEKTHSNTRLVTGKNSLCKEKMLKHSGMFWEGWGTEVPCFHPTKLM